MPTLPNLVYIGPDKAGSTWLFHLLTHHEDVFVTPAKDLYFFDRFFDNGLVAEVRRRVDPIVERVSPFAGAGGPRSFQEHGLDSGHASL